MITQESLKREAAEAAIAAISDGMVVGLGTGSTAAFAIRAIARKVKNGLRIVGVPTSQKSADLAASEGIELGDLSTYPSVDVTIDGADAVETGTLNLIKGLGGALLREKIVATVSKKLIIVVDESKVSECLGKKSMLPVEVVQFGWNTTAARLETLGAACRLRDNGDGQPFVSDGGNYILDCRFGEIKDPQVLCSRIAEVVGVVESGLFINMTDEVIVGGNNGIKVLRRDKR